MMDQNADITCIFEGLSGKGDIFLSNQSTSNNITLIQSLNISAIISISRNQLQGATRQILDYYSHLELQWGELLNISDHSASVYQFIDEARKRTNVLLCCETGNKESAVFAITYLIKKYPYNLNKVFNLVKRRRNQISISQQYITQLNKFAYFLNAKDPGIKQGNNGHLGFPRVSCQTERKKSCLSRNNYVRISSLVHNTPIFQLKKESCESPQKYIQNRSGLMRLEDQIKQFAQQLKGYKIQIRNQQKQNIQQEANDLSQKQQQIKLEKEVEKLLLNQANDENKNTINLPEDEFQRKISAQLEREKQNQNIIDDGIALRFQKFLRRQTKYKTLFEPSNRQFSPQNSKIPSLTFIQDINRTQEEISNVEQTTSLLKQSVSFDSNSIHFFSKQLLTEKQIVQDKKIIPRSRSQSSTLKSALKKNCIKTPSQSKKTVKFSTQNVIHDFSQTFESRKTQVIQIIEKKNEQKKTFLSYNLASVSFGGKILR